MSRYSPTAAMLARATVRYMNRRRPKNALLKDVIGHNIANRHNFKNPSWQSFLNGLDPQTRALYEQRMDAEANAPMGCLIITIAFIIVIVVLVSISPSEPVKPVMSECADMEVHAYHQLWLNSGQNPLYSCAPDRDALSE